MRTIIVTTSIKSTEFSKLALYAPKMSAYVPKMSVYVSKLSAYRVNSFLCTYDGTFLSDTVYCIQTGSGVLLWLQCVLIVSDVGLKKKME